MLEFFLNPWMLAGLAGIALPIIAHLLVRRRYNVVEWGAMQFLQPGVRTRRKLRLQDLLLLLVRIALISLVAIALARPWIPSGLFSGYHSAGSRDVVLVIDSSNSMARPDGISTLHQTALRRATEYLSTLSANDTVMVIDARDLPVLIIDSPTSDRNAAEVHINEIDPPGGFGDLHQACERAVSLLSQASQARRDIVIFTDGQRAGWDPDDTNLWSQFSNQLELTAVRPQIWAVDCSNPHASARNIISVGRIVAEPENSVPDVPVRLRTTVTNHSDQPVTVPLSFEVQGQGLAEHDSTVTIKAKAQTTVEITHQFASQDTRLIRLVAELNADDLQIDNSSHCVIVTRPPIKILLVESSNSLDHTQHHSFFVELAMTPPPGVSTWLQPRVVPAAELQSADIDSADVVILPDVDSLPANAAEWLEQAVRSGTGLLISAGSHTTPEFFRQSYADSGLLPGTHLLNQKSVDPDAAVPIRVLPSSLRADWLHRFQDRPDTSFLQTVFNRWWDVETHSQDDEPPIHTLIRLTNRAPILFFHQHHKGRVLLFATAFDNQWNNLPGRPDFVSFLYEAIFQLSPQRTRRNVMPGEPFVAPLRSTEPSDLMARLPSGRMDTVRLRAANKPTSGLAGAETGMQESQRVLRYEKTYFPGYYEISNRDDDSRIDAFAVEYNRSEDSTDQLTEKDRQFLEQDNRIRFRDSLRGLTQQMYGNESTTEIWAMLLMLFAGLLIVEAWMTQRLVRQRHGQSGNSVMSPVTTPSTN
jgi:hypothetical protein